MGAEAAHNRGQDATTPRSGVVPPHATIAERHTQYLEDRGVGERQAAQAFWTARKPSETPEAFSKYQRRGVPALIAAFPSPDLETVGYQMYSDYPGKNRDGKKLKWVSPPGDNARMVLGVLPEMLDSVRTGAGPIWSVEGITRAAALASFVIPAVAFAGCWGWQKDGAPLECWRHVSLNGRTVLVAFDADYRTNPDVHEALRRHVAFLQGRGARVLVVDVPRIDGNPNTGLDDWIAARGHPAPLERNAQPFKPVDVVRERLKADTPLRERIRGLWAEWRAMPARKMAECSNRAAMRALLGKSELRGKLVDDGVFVILSSRDGAEAAQISLGGWKISIDRLEEAGRVRREMWGRNKDKAGAYVLLTPGGEGRALREHKGTKGGRKGEEKETETELDKEEKQSFPHSDAESLPRVHVTRAPSGELPPLRWPKVVHTWGQKEGRRVVVDSQYIARLGKRREEIVRRALEDGPTPVMALFEEFGPEKGRVRDFRRRMLGPLEEEGIFEVAGDEVGLTPAWREALERARERDGELEDAKLQREKHERQKEVFRQWRKFGIEADPTPELPGKEKVRHLFGDMEQRDEAARLEQQRSKVGTTVETFIHDILAQMGKIRMGLLRDLWRDKGGDPSHVLSGIRGLGCKLERLPKHDNELFVFPRAVREAERESAATVTEIPAREKPAEVDYTTEEPLPNPPPAAESTIVERSTNPPKSLSKVDGIFVHGPLCDCFLCEDDSEPSYARPIGGRASRP